MMVHVFTDNKIFFCLTSEARPGPGCSKLTTSLVNVWLKFQTVISQIRQYFLLKKCEKLLQCKSFSHFFRQKISVYLLIKSGLGLYFSSIGGLKFDGDCCLV